MPLGTIAPLALCQSLVPVAAGLVAGSLAAVALDRVLASMLTDVPSVDTAVVAGAAPTRAAAAFVAAIVPTLRGARVDPASALKAE